MDTKTAKRVYIHRANDNVYVVYTKNRRAAVKLLRQITPVTISMANKLTEVMLTEVMLTPSVDLTAMSPDTIYRLSVPGDMSTLKRLGE